MTFYHIQASHQHVLGPNIFCFPHCLSWPKIQYVVFLKTFVPSKCTFFPKLRDKLYLDFHCTPLSMLCLQLSMDFGLHSYTSLTLVSMICNGISLEVYLCTNVDWWLLYVCRMFYLLIFTCAPLWINEKLEWQ